ncbi:hypothetical protein VOM14_02740 [Paraburkholderia sp. MPAMCS5]|nr:hypothetical protein [Paraburkholderia sp. MPAMCS5]
MIVDPLGRTLVDISSGVATLCSIAVVFDSRLIETSAGRQMADGASF